MISRVCSVCLKIIGKREDFCRANYFELNRFVGDDGSSFVEPITNLISLDLCLNCVDEMRKKQNVN